MGEGMPRQPNAPTFGSKTIRSAQANNGARTGRVNVTSGGKTSTIYRPGWAVRIAGPGQPPSANFTNQTGDARFNPTFSSYQCESGATCSMSGTTLTFGGANQDPAGKLTVDVNFQHNNSGVSGETVTCPTGGCGTATALLPL